jgi:hypothetical protein
LRSVGKLPDDVRQIAPVSSGPEKIKQDFEILHFIKFRYWQSDIRKLVLAMQLKNKLSGTMIYFSA